MFRLRRWVFGALFVVGALLLTVEPLGSQPPGGGFGPPGGGRFGGKGGFNFNDPETVFNFYAKGADVIDVSRMDPSQKAFLQRSFERRGIPIPPDNAVITKAQFVESFNRAQAARGMTPGGPPGGFGGDRGDRRGPPGFGGDRPPMTTSFGPGGFGGDRRGFGGSGPPSFGGDRRGWGGGDRQDGGGFRMSDEDIERRFTESDANKDGKLSPDEISDRSPLKSSFKDADTNTDGYIDRDEYKKYIAARFGGDSNGGSGDGGFGSSESRRDKEKPKEEPLVAIRYGKLPAGLPDWWNDLDTDKDGQVGLYEWRADGRDVKEFVRMDLDGDGLLAPQDWQRFNVQEALKAKAVAAEEGIEVPGSGGSGRDRGSFGSGRGGPGGNGGMRGSWPGGGKGGDKSPDGEGRGKGKGGDNNPFRQGGKKKG